MFNTTRTHKLRLLASASFICMLGATGQAFAADNSVKLKDVVVSANRTPTAVSNLGSSVTVVTSEDLEKSQAVTLEDALNDIPGLYVYSNGNSATNTRFRLRGFDSGRVLVLIDGVKIDNQASQMYDRPYNHLQATDIERIEVLKGSQSALYGSDAIGGVISITTKSGKGSGKLVQGTASTEIGTDVTRRISTSVFGEYNNFYYKLSGSAYGTHGHDSRRNVDPNESDGSRNVNYGAKLGADLITDYGYLDLLNIETNFNYQDGDAEYDTSSKPNDTDGFYNQITETAHLRLKADLFDGLLKNTFSISRLDSYTNARSYRNSGSQSQYWGDMQRYEYEGVLAPVENHTVVFGVEQERDHYRYNKKTGDVTSSHDNASLVNSSAYAQYGVDLFDKTLSLTFGGRQEFHDTFGQHTTYRGTASYLHQPTETRFHASYGTGFKAPTLKQALYNRHLAPGDLEPEESRGYDFGVEQSLMGGRLVMDVTAFNNRMTNQIESKGSGGNRYYVNIGSSRHMGMETSADFEATDELNFVLGYTYTQSRNNATGMAMEETPAHLASLRINYAPEEVEGLQTWVKVKAVSKTYDNSESPRNHVGGYAVWDLGAEYEIDSNFAVYGRVENLFDKNYGEMYNFNNAGIGASTGLRLKF
jgi:vitamin B12 transporter